MERSKSLDGLKGLCCLPIIFVHYKVMSRNVWGIPLEDLPFFRECRFLYEYGWTLIFPFFCISGFLMAAHYRSRIKEMDFINYITHRMRVLFPMMVASTTIGIIISLIDGRLTGHVTTSPIKFWTVILNYALMCSEWAEPEVITPYGSGTWFVCVLLLCYIYYYVIVKYLDERKYHLYIIAAFFIGWTLYSYSVSIPFLSGRGGYCAFFAGTILYEFMYGQFSDVIMIKLSDKCRLIISIILVPGLALAILTGGFVVNVMMVLLPPLFIYYCMKVKWAKKILEMKPFQILGKLSMSIYLSHMLIQRVVIIVIKHLGLDCSFGDVSVWAVTFSLCFVGAVLFYLIIEKHFVGFFNSICSRVFC